MSLKYARRRITVGLNWLVIVLVFLPCEPLSATPKPRNKQQQRIPVLQYHDDWVCVNKPEGLTVHRSRGFPRSRQVLTTTLKRQLSRKVFPVHRLDHRTSGAILLAFDSYTTGLLHDVAVRKGKKKYIALVRGEWGHPHELIVDRPLKVQDEEMTKDAKTKFTLLATTTGDDNMRSSLLLCEPLTGRTHQIRRHVRSIGHPIIGDSQHGDSKINRWWRENKGLHRLALHCWSIEFRLNEEDHTCIAPLSEEFQGVLQSTSLWAGAVKQESKLAMKPFDERGGSYGRNYQESQKLKDER